MTGDMKNKPEDFWKQKLTPEQYYILREKGTEIPGTGKFLHETSPGSYACAACGSLVFKSDHKYESTTPGLIGWPSFSEAANNNAVDLKEDTSFGMRRTEVICKTCGSHLGHLFDDDSSPNNKHFCINSVSLQFEPQKPA